jgi:hypothetical protein
LPEPALVTKKLIWFCCADTRNDTVAAITITTTATDIHFNIAISSEIAHEGHGPRAGDHSLGAARQR